MFDLKKIHITLKIFIYNELLIINYNLITKLFSKIFMYLNYLIFKQTHARDRFNKFYF